MPRRLFVLHTVPGRIRTLTALALLALIGLVAGAAVATWQANDGLRAIGSGEGPTVVATSDLYLALSDMDAQATTALLAGGEAGWLCQPELGGQDQNLQGRPPTADTGCDRPPTRVLYEIRREEAQRAAMAAAERTGGDSVRLTTVQTVLDELHLYDQQVQAAMEAAAGTTHPAGVLPPDAIGRYRMATRLMTDDLLPKAYNLTLANRATMNAAYEDRRSAVLSGRDGAAVNGALAIVVLVILQIYLAVRFRRVLSPFLAVATLGAVALTVASASLLSTEAEYLREAKAGGFDPVLALSRTEALGKSLDADRSRFLLDPRDADRYDQLYLEKSQTILYIPGANSLSAYYTKLDALFDDHDGGSHSVGFGGFYGQEARQVAVRGEREYFRGLLSRYQQYQHNDRRVRELADDGKRGEAAKVHMNPDPGVPLPHPVFQAHDEGLGALITRHQYFLDGIVLNGEGAIRAWLLLLPGSVLAIAALVVAGVRPRLNEYR
jgi:hypothetical protein